MNLLVTHFKTHVLLQSFIKCKLLPVPRSFKFSFCKSLPNSIQRIAENMYYDYDTAKERFYFYFIID